MQFASLVPCLDYECRHRPCEVDSQLSVSGAPSHKLLPLSVGISDLIPKSSEPLHNARGAAQEASEYVSRVLLGAMLRCLATAL